jgi:nicotinamidase-related amidase
MPVTALDKKTALVLIDLQKAIVSRPTAPHTASDVVVNSAALVSAFRKAGQPIVIVNVIPGERPASSRSDFRMPPMQFQKEWAEIVPEIEVKDNDILITKHTWNAFHNTALDEKLKEQGVTGIVMAGIATSIGVEGTARAAYERGYNLTFASDAMTDMNEKAHENSLTVIFPRIGEVDTTHAIVGVLG